MAALRTGAIVQLQQLPHVTPNSATDAARKWQEAWKNMAYLTTTAAARKSIVDRLAALRQTWAEALQKRRVYAQTLAELNALTDRELADLGIPRSDIAEIAYRAAYADQRFGQ
jgi:uncharacterized protein YjiS (DUF1127 family)